MRRTVRSAFLHICATAAGVWTGVAPALGFEQPYAITFPAQETRFLRLVIRASSGGEPCIDELELYGPDGGENLALAERGAVADASSCLPGYAIHAIAHLNDGRHGNSHSWIAATTGEEWAQIELPQPAPVTRVVISRDRTGQYRDRMALDMEVLLSDDGLQWRPAARVRRPAPRAGGYVPTAELPVSGSWEDLVEYAFRCEKAAWDRLPANDHLSPLQVDRPAVPGGEPYWGRIARLDPFERVLVLFEELAARLEGAGLDVGEERRQAAELRAAQRALAAGAQGSEAAERLYFAARHARRRLFLRDPALDPLRSILFVKRHPLLASHNYSDVLDAQFRPGGGIYTLQIPRDAQGRLDPARGALRCVVDTDRGIVRDPAIDFDARTVVFAYRGPGLGATAWESYWHLFYVSPCGEGLAQLTDGPYHDFDPLPLPDGGVAFNSTRCRARFLCWRPQAYVLFRMQSDGTGIRPLSFANISEWTPSMLRDGRILWTRSEYIDKGADFGHTLWAIRPDGTHPELIFGNNTPNCYIHAREVPGRNEIVCTLFSHGGDHNGPIGLIDLDRVAHDPGGMVSREMVYGQQLIDCPRPSPHARAITNITPDVRPHYNMSWARHECFRDPTPISPDHFLVSHAPADHFGLYVIDRYGNRELLYLDPAIGSMSPQPLAPRERPPVLPAAGDPRLAAEDMGRFTVADVYLGIAPHVARGRVKYLRVVQELRADLERLSTGEYRGDHEPFQDFYATPVHLVSGPAGWPSYVAKADLGLVPVAADGSVDFHAPAGKVLYFQLLDGEYNELQRMRSVVQLQPGEQRGCIGCHEDRRSAPPVQAPLALRQPPRRLEPPPWGAGPFAYERVVQPVLNAHCVSCHHGPGSAEPDLCGVRDAERIPASYRALIAGGWVHYFDWTYGLRHHKAEPLSFGTLESRIWEVLDDAHHTGVRLGREDLRAIKTWIDLNCPLWGDYTFRMHRPAQWTPE